MNQGKIIDILSVIHFFIYFCLGLIIKNNYKFALFIGITWEIFEYIITNMNYTKNLLKKYWPINLKYWEEKNKLNKVFDLLFNMLGYYIGNKL